MFRSENKLLIIKYLQYFIILALAGCAGIANNTAPQEILKPGDNLVTDGIPAIPATLAQSVKAYTEYRPKIFNNWHPSKREMLIATRAGNANQIHLLAAPMGKPQQLTRYAEPVTGASYQPTQGNYFVFAKDTGGNEVHQFYRSDFAGKTALLTDERLRNGNAVWSHKGDRFVHSAVETDKSRQQASVVTQVRIVNPDDGTQNKLIASLPGGGWENFAWSPDDKTLATIEYISINESIIWLLDIASGEKTRVTQKSGNQPVSHQGVEFSADGKGLYTASDADSEFLRLIYLNLVDKATTVLTPDTNWDVENFAVSRDGKFLAYVVNDSGASKLHVMETATRKIIAQPVLPQGTLSSLQWHRSLPELAFSLSSARSPADVYSFDVNSTKLTRWTSSAGEGRDTADFVEPELVIWKSFDGREISGFLYRAPAKFGGKRPLVINIHGGPEGQFRPGFLARNNYFLNELGVHILFPNVRGSAGYGKTFLKLDNGMLREDSVKDIGALFDWLGAQPAIDASRVLVTGGSYGGYMSLAVATLYPEKIAASIDVVGISNFVTFLERTESYRRDLRRVEYGDERDPAMRAFLQTISPLNRADKIAKPLFVVQGKNDPRVPFSEAEQIVATLKKSNTPVWYLVANDEGHGFAKKSNADFQFYSTIAFMRQYLLKN
jgi:prolyl oligopeptidase PreP (S9A serine peptidase family)